MMSTKWKVGCDMHKIFDSYIVYVFPDGYKRLGLNCSWYELKQLTLKHGTPIKTIESYEQVQTWGGN